MSWSFWKRKSDTVDASKPKEEKLPKPMDIPESVGRSLVVDFGKDPDWVWHLKSVVHRREEKNCYEVRVFDESQAMMHGIIVRDFTSLDEHPELILFEGWYDKKSNKVQVQERLEPTPKAA